MLLLFFFLAALSAAPLPPFTLFDWNASSTGYIINGTSCQTITIGGVLRIVNCTRSQLIVDPPNGRWLLDLDTGGGKFIALPTAAYNVGNALLGGACAQIVNWNYSAQVAGYKTVKSIPGSTSPGKAIYAGLARDIGACQHDLGGTLHVQNDIVLEFDWAQRFPLPGGSPCILAGGVFEFDISTLDTRSNRDSYFVLPPSCATPLDYCARSYPPGNLCAVPQ
jgi:hypothetical protein